MSEHGGSGSAHSAPDHPDTESEEYEGPEYRGVHSNLTRLKASHPRYMQTKMWRESAFSSKSFWGGMDRVQVLGDEEAGGYGHTGCVNALCWSASGQTLISSGDDCRICIWQPNPLGLDDSTPLEDSSFETTLVLETGHTNNVFNIQFLPYTNDSTVVSCAADKQIRVFDIAGSGGGVPYTSGKWHWEERREERCCTRVLNCHRGRVKRIVTEDSPFSFLTVAEDHTVRQHDLRTTHRCGTSCPAPLVRVPHSLSSLSSSPLAPWLFLVAGESPFGHLFDRRMVGRILKHEWGMEWTIENDESQIHCVRRFGRMKRPEGGRSSHVTGTRMADSNNHELIMSYSGDAVYLYSLRDQPSEKPIKTPSLLPKNKKRGRVIPKGTIEDAIAILASQEESSPLSDLIMEDAEGGEPEDNQEESSDSDTELDEPDEYDPWGPDSRDNSLNASVIFPRRMFKGASNVETVKDANFLGPKDEWISSGSDDGNFFIWSKATGRLIGIYEGDQGVVNVVEDRPGDHSFPLLAASGLDNTVKLFGPSPSPQKFCHNSRASEIIRANASQAGGSRGFSRLLRTRGLRFTVNGEPRECVLM